MPWPEFSAAASSASARLLIRERAESFLSRVTLSADDSAWLVEVSGFLTLADSLAELRLLLELSERELFWEGKMDRLVGLKERFVEG